MRNGEVGDDPEMNVLKFKDGRLSQILLHDDDGTSRVISANDLKTDLQYMPALYINAGFSSLVLPASSSSFMLTPGNVGDIELVYADVDEIADIADVTGDGDAFGYKYTVSDIYGANVDITAQATNPVGKLIDIRLATVQPATYTGQELKPVVTYDGKTLVEGVDYVLENDSGKPFVEPGEYDVTIWGIGDYVEFQLGTFVINPADESEAADPSPYESANKDAEASNPATTKGSPAAATSTKTGDSLMVIVGACMAIAVAAVTAALIAARRRK